MNLELEKRVLEVKKIIGDAKHADEISVEAAVQAEPSFAALLKEIEGLIYKYVHKFPSLKQRYGVTDLFWRGAAKAWYSLPLYDPTKGVRFITYFTTALNSEFVSFLEHDNRVPGGKKKSANLKEFVRRSLDNGKSELQIMRDCARFFPEHLVADGKTLLFDVAEYIRQLAEAYDWKEREQFDASKFEFPCIGNIFWDRAVKEQGFSNEEENRIIVRRLLKEVTNPADKRILHIYLDLCRLNGEARFIDIANNLSLNVSEVYKAFSNVRRLVLKENVFAV
jgi:hypothetical protein